MSELGEIPEGVDLTYLPAGEPPAGVEPDFVDPYTRGPAYIAVAAVCMALAACFVFARLWTRLFVLKNPWWDDLVVVIALLCQAAYCGLNIWLCLHGVGKQMYNVYFLDFMNLVDPAQAMAIVTEPAIGFTKLALLLFFCRLFWRNNLTRIGSLAGIFVVVVTYTTLFFLFIFLEYDDIARCNQAMAVLNIATDFYILVLPIPVVVGLQLPTKKKYALIGLFSTGFLCCVLSIIGAYYRWAFSENLTNFTWDLWNVILVNTIECAVGIICACIPVLPALLKSGSFSGRWLTPLRTVKDRFRTTNHSATGRSRQDNMSKSYTKVDDDQTDPSIELGQRDRNALATSENTYLQTPPSAHRPHPAANRPPNGYSHADAYGRRSGPQPPATGIQVRRDWSVDSTTGGHS